MLLFNYDIFEGVKVFISCKITMSKITKKFEIEFVKFSGSKYFLMVNSIFLANLLGFFALINHKKKYFNYLNYIIKNF